MRPSMSVNGAEIPDGRVHFTQLRESNQSNEMI